MLISGIFDNVEQVEIKERKLLDSDYYSVYSKDATLYIKSDLFVMTVFSRGSDWAEDIFKKAFSTGSVKTEVVEGIEINPEDTVFNITVEQQKFDYGIVIKSHSFNDKKTESKAEEREEISLPVVIRIFSKTIPISEMENIGEMTEILISQQPQFNVELLVNGRVIGEGVLRKEQDSLQTKNIKALYVNV
ncbi:MAG: hypothetical protein Q9M89_05680, partial [Persephonella sp.]|nr:hypothetical protein [Persephonella sp.]